MVDEKLIKIAKTPESNFLLQAELKAIKQGYNSNSISIQMETDTKGILAYKVIDKELEY